MKVSTHPGAAQDLTDAFRFYRREAGAAVARRFLAEVERVSRLLCDFPELGTPTGDQRRAYPLTGFPYSIIYCANEGDLRILVFRHHSRDPEHGESRR